MQLDHVLIAATARPPDTPELPSASGLEPTVGGRHPGWGTANWIVPLGDSYLELIAVVDEPVARQSVFGRRILGSADGSTVGWAVRPNDLAATAGRLDLDLGEGSRMRPSGERVEWRMAGIEEAVERPWLPFFIEWGDPASFPGATRTPAARAVRLEIEGDADELARWLGPNELPLDVRVGTAGVTAVALETPNGPIVLGRPREG
jgi:hypothetical protein